jgi:hypothetical protein
MLQTRQPSKESRFRLQVLIIQPNCSKLTCIRGMEFPLRGLFLKPATRLITPANPTAASGYGPLR